MYLPYELSMVPLVQGIYSGIQRLEQYLPGHDSENPQGRYAPMSAFGAKRTFS